MKAPETLRKARPSHPRPAQALPALALALALATLLPACSPGGGSPLAGPGDPAALAVLRSVYLRDRDIPTMAIRGDVSYSKGNERWHFGFELISERGRGFLFTILDPVGGPAYRILAEEGSLKALDYRQRIFYAGPASERPLEDFLPLPLSTGDFLSLLAGLLPQEPVWARPETPLEDGRAVANLLFSTASADDPGPWRAQLSGPGFKGGDSPALLRLSRGPVGRPSFQVRYDRRSPTPREDSGALVEFPDGLSAFWAGAQDLRVLATYREVRLGFAMPQGVFVLERPPSFEMRPL